MPIPSPTPEMILTDPPSLMPESLSDFPYAGIQFPIDVFSVLRPTYTNATPNPPRVE